MTVEPDDIELAEQLASTEKTLQGCSAEFYEFVTELMEHNSLEMPDTPSEGKELYIKLCSLIDDFEE